MLFYVFAGLAGFLLILIPLILLTRASKKFSLPRSLFWKVGFYHIVISFLYLGVIGNLGSVWPGFEESPVWIQALVIGIISGLFLELGRFVVLDRFQKKIRDFKSGIFFGLGWSGVNAILLGILAIINSFGLYYLAQTADLKTQFPEISIEQLQILEDAQKQAQAFAQGNPLVGLTPLLENAVFLFVDIALTLLMIMALNKGQNRWVWLAVGIRAVFSGVNFYLLSLNLLWGELAIIGFGILAVLFSLKLKENLD